MKNRDFVDTGIKCLVDEALWDASGCYWPILNDKNETDLSNLSLYSGQSGYLLTLIEYCGICKKHSIDYASCRHIVEHALNWGYQQAVSTLHQPSASFVVGDLSLAYAMLRWSIIANDKKWTSSSLLLTSVLMEHADGLSQEYISGKSGVIAFLVLLQSHVGLPIISQLIRKYSVSLLEDAIVSAEGYAWCYQDNYCKPLCGFAHGNAGVLFALDLAYGSEMDQRMPNMIRNGLLYEDAQFNNEDGNWPNYLNSVENQFWWLPYLSRYLQNGKLTICQPASIHAWCHGSVGVLMQRLLLRCDPRLSCYYFKEFKSVVDKLSNDVMAMIQSADQLNLCHSGLDVADLLLLLNRLGYKCSKDAMSKFMKNLEDRSSDWKLLKSGLFTGDLGMLYMAIRIDDPCSAPSVLYLDR